MMSPNLCTSARLIRTGGANGSILSSTCLVRLHSVSEVEKKGPLTFAFIIGGTTTIALSESRVNQRQRPHRIWPHSNTSPNFREAFCGLVDFVRYTKTRQANGQGQT